MSATEFGLVLLYVAVAAVWYLAGWWNGRHQERDRWGERAADVAGVGDIDRVAHGLASSSSTSAWHGWSSGQKHIRSWPVRSPSR